MMYAMPYDYSRDCIRGLGVKRLKEAYDILDNFEADDLEVSVL